MSLCIAPTLHGSMRARTGPAAACSRRPTFGQHHLQARLIRVAYEAEAVGLVRRQWQQAYLETTRAAAGAQPQVPEWEPQASQQVLMAERHRKP